MEMPLTGTWFLEERASLGGPRGALPRKESGRQEVGMENAEGALTVSGVLATARLIRPGASLPKT